MQPEMHQMQAQAQAQAQLTQQAKARQLQQAQAQQAQAQLPFQEPPSHQTKFLQRFGLLNQSEPTHPSQASSQPAPLLPPSFSPSLPGMLGSAGKTWAEIERAAAADSVAWAQLVEASTKASMAAAQLAAAAAAAARAESSAGASQDQSSAVAAAMTAQGRALDTALQGMSCLQQLPQAASQGMLPNNAGAFAQFSYQHLANNNFPAADLTSMGSPPGISAACRIPPFLGYPGSHKAAASRQLPPSSLQPSSSMLPAWHPPQGSMQASSAFQAWKRSQRQDKQKGVGNKKPPTVVPPSISVDEPASTTSGQATMPGSGVTSPAGEARPKAPPSAVASSPCSPAQASAASVTPSSSAGGEKSAAVLLRLLLEAGEGAGDEQAIQHSGSLQ